MSVIFLTISDEYAVETFAMNAAHYLLKPFSQEQFNAALDRAVKKTEEQDILSLACVDGVYRVRISEIISVGSQSCYLLLGLSSGEKFRLRMKLSQMFEGIQKYPEFIKGGASYVVNLVFVRSISGNSMEMFNGVKIPVPRGAVRKCRKHIWSFAEGGKEMSELYQIPGLFFTALCHVVVIYHMLEHRYAKRKFVLLSCLYMVSFVCMGGYAYVVRGRNALLTYLVIAVCLFLFFCTVSKDRFSKKCFLFLTYFGLFSIIDNSLKLMVKIFLPQLFAPAGYYLVSVLRMATLLLILALYKRYAAPVMQSLADIEKGRWWNLALIALLFYLLQAAVSILNERNVVPDMYLLLIFIAISLVMCAVYAVVFNNISYMKKDAEVALIRQNAEYLSNQLSVLQNSEEINRRLRHDMRHHIDTITEYAKTGDNSAILAYIMEYGNEISEATVKQYSANRTVNSILSVYAGRAEKNGIDFSVQCNVPKELKVRETDIIALLGNLLENALHGCQESGKEYKSIKFHIRLQNSRLIILCNNTCLDNLKLSGGLPVEKGIGISSILSVCRKYDGNLDYKIEDESCSVRMVLNL